MRDAGLCALADEVEDGCAGGLGACAGGCRDGDEREERLGDWEAFAERGVDEVKEVVL